MKPHSELLEIQQRGDDHFFKILAVLWSSKLWIILGAIVFGALGLLTAMTKTPQYQAEALVQLETKSSGVQLSTDIAEMLAPESEAITEIEILKSKLVLGKVVEALNLDVVATPNQLPVFGNLISRLNIPRPSWKWLSPYAWNTESIKVSTLQVPADWKGLPVKIINNDNNTYTIGLPNGLERKGMVGEELSLEDVDFSITLAELTGELDSQFTVRKLSARDAIGKIRIGIQVTENPRSSGIIRVAMISDAPETSENIVAAVVDAYVAQNIGRSAEEAERSLSFLEQQIPLVQSQLRQAEAELNEYRLKSESIDLNYEAQSILERTVILDAQLSTLSLEESELSRRYTTNHPAYSALLDKKRRLEAEKADVAVTVQNLPNTQQEILRKTRDVEVSQQIYLQLLNKSQELSVMKAGAVGNVRLIDEAAANPIPVLPNLSSTTVLGVLLGAFVMGVLCIIRYNLYKEVDTPEDLSKLNVPTLAIVPISPWQLKINRRRETTLLADQQPNEIAIESVRALRTNLYSSMFDRDRNIIAITGPSPKVGKSFISGNLAFLTAKTGARVLVIDADMRRGNLGKYFNLSKNLPGLAQVLDGTCDKKSVMYQVDLNKMQLINAQKMPKKLATVEINHDLGVPVDTFNDIYIEQDPTLKQVLGEGTAPYPRNEKEHSITVIPRGQSVNNPSELLMTERLPELMEYASQHFDVVIIDTPPVLAATDAMIVSKYADINLMVVRHGETSIHEAEEVARTFNNNEIKLNGIVLNGYHLQQGRYGKYGAQYGYRYTYD